ncbi:MAG: hypothetical protein IAG13_02430 [Deltaproteobacteria bacterium]|nr:hypothetical protein [Nannocystaceae bacterium]
MTTPSSSLVDKLTAPDVRPQVVAACVSLVDREVASKGGLSGMAVKAGYAVIKAVKPGFVAQVVETLLPEFAAAMEPIYTREGAAGPEAFTRYLEGHRDEVADALLTVTDARAQRAKNPTIKKTYDRLRGSARDNVSAAVPNLAATLRPFL